MDPAAALTALAAAFPGWRFGRDTGSWWAAPPPGFSYTDALSTDDPISLARYAGEVEAWEEAAAFLAAQAGPQDHVN